MDSGLKRGFAGSSNSRSSTQPGTDKVKATATDTVSGYLKDKLTAGNKIAITTDDDTVTVAVTGLATVANTGSYNDLSDKPTLGTAAALDVGTGANDIPQLDGLSRLPAVDGSQLTNLPVVGGGGLEIVYANTVSVNATSGKQYLLDGTTTVNLPLGTNGFLLGIADYGRNFSASPVTILPSGSDTIDGQASLVLDTDRASVELGFYGGNWTIVGAETFYDLTSLAPGQWIVDTGVPGVEIGNNGDLYLDDGTGDVYQKSAGAWSSVANINGDTGATGPSGQNGFGLRYTFSATTTAPPSSGELRLNNATIASVTEIYIHETDRNSADISAILSQITNGSQLLIFDESNPSNYAYFTLTSQTDDGSYDTFSVAHVASNGTFTGDVTLTYTLKGADGATGSNGADGVSGFGLRYTFSATTTGPASSGEIRLNNATVASVTEVYVHETDRLSANVASLLASITDGSQILIAQDSDPANYAYFSLTSQTDNGSDRTFIVSHVASAGTMTGNVSLTFAAKGTTGATGATGTVGANTGVIITESTAPTTAVSELALWVDSNNDLYARPESDGTSEKVLLAGDLSPIVLPHIATPSAPSAGNTALYAKSDNKLYIRPSGGSETEVGAGGGGHTIQDEGTPLTSRTNLNFVGAGVTVTDDSGNDATVVTIPGGGGGGITWTEVTGTTQAMVVDNGYIANNASQVVFTLPTTCAVGKVVAVTGKGAGGWKVEQGSGQQIHFGSASSTSGVSGYIQSTSPTVQYACVELVCVTADTIFVVRGSTGVIEVI